MGNSKYLDSLNADAKKNLSKKLWEIQNHKCFICEQEIHLDINSTNIDHIHPLQMEERMNHLILLLRTNTAINLNKMRIWL